jgi:4-amino-4-deoxy-L-arabinose transferase-like glycosyltransferase
VPLVSQFKLHTKEAWEKDWILFLFLKIVIAIFLPLFSDEAYYWTWSQNLKLSYFDHPPFISWLFFMGTPLENFYSAARIPAVILGHFTIWVWCGLIARNYSSVQKRQLFWLLNVHTLIGFGSFVANPDVPFLFFWSLSVYFFIRSVEKMDSLKYPLYLGIALGMGFDSKYLISLFVPLAFFYLVLTGKWKGLRWQHYLLPPLFGAAFSLPVWIWNFQNNWASFKFQMDHGLGKTWRPQWTGDFLLGTILLLFPPLVYLFFKKKVYRNFKDFNVFVFILLFLFFTYTTTGGPTELNWPLALYPSFFFILLPYLKRGPLFNSFVIFFGSFGILLLTYSFISPEKTLHPRLTEASLYKKIYAQSQPYSPLYTSTYQSASYFWFISKRPYFKLRYASRPDEFDLMANSQPQQDLFYYLKEQYQVFPPEQTLLFRFEKVADLDNNFEVYRVTRK